MDNTGMAPYTTLTYQYYGNTKVVASVDVAELDENRKYRITNNNSGK